jgi:hypothetical protein
MWWRVGAEVEKGKRNFNVKELLSEISWLL